MRARLFALALAASVLSSGVLAHGFGFFVSPAELQPTVTLVSGGSAEISFALAAKEQPISGLQVSVAVDPRQATVESCAPDPRLDGTGKGVTIGKSVLSNGNELTRVTLSGANPVSIGDGAAFTCSLAVFSGPGTNVTVGFERAKATNAAAESLTLIVPSSLAFMAQ